MKISVRLTVAPGVAVVAAVLGLVGCGSSHGSSAVPSLSASGAAAGSSHAGYSTSRVAALHAAAQCIRTHGIPSYQDPVLTADGQVYTDSRSILDFESAAGVTSGGKGNGNSALDAIRTACGTLMATAGFQPDDQAPAPPKLVQAGVKLAQCLRANGLPNYRDPTSSSPFTPGHGFGISADELPNNGAGGKADPTFQRALTACQALNNAEITASDLTNLAHD
jgi:hypothetical protein